MQVQQYNSSFSNMDAYIYKYKFYHSSAYDCLYESVITSAKMASISTLIAQSTFYQRNLISLYSLDSDLQRTKTQGYFTPYVSKYSGGFNLEDSMQIPRPCAFKSSNLTAVSYYRGQDSTQYKITDQNKNGNIITMMN